MDGREPRRGESLTGPGVAGAPTGTPEAELVAEAARLAEVLLRAAESSTTPAERRRARRLAGILADARARDVLAVLTDEVLRTSDPHRAMARFRSLTAGPLPEGFRPLDRVALRAAALGGRLAPRIAGRAVRARIQHETRGVILPAEDPAFADHVRRRRAEGFDVNVNLLGEAILGDDEAAARFRAVGQRLARPDVQTVSVKISALCANLDVLAFDHSVERIVARLQPLLRLAGRSDPPKLVNLDMEEHRDLALTAAAFCRALDDPDLAHVPAGIALQAYVPDSHAVLDELIAWAERRRRAGGSWVRVRLVKGANLAMERVAAELAGWPQAPYATKAEVDASYKRLLDRALEAATDGVLRVGVASHNLFDVAWALTLRDRAGLQDAVEIEMLEGMAPAQARAARLAAGRLLLYTPVVAKDDTPASIAYLARRLDENTGDENFLRALFSLQPGSPTWREEQAKFQAAVAARASVSTEPRHRQDRRTERVHVDPDAPFAHEPDTDFTIAANRAWIGDALRTWANPATLEQLRPPLVTHPDAIDEMVATAIEAARSWRTTSTAERRQVLARAAEAMAAARGRTIAVMAAETGKTVREGDPEVSEGVDMARWALASTRLLDELTADGVAWEPCGVVLVAGPWNFPYAIPANGVLSALAAGNAVLLKPAPEAVATGAELVRQLHEAGVPRPLVQLVRCPDDDTGRHLVTHPGIDRVILTGSYATAQLFLDWKPSLALLAETSGKNALVITGGADLDLAIADLVRSAFGHAGQKCSAASLAIVEAGIHDDPRFQARLADAVRSLRVGDATDLATIVGPVIHPPTDPLRRGLTQLDPGERWLVEPRPVGDDGRSWTPGVRLGVQPGSWYHRTECFGPVLGVLRARDLDHALELQNDSEFGLTGGLHSLDPAEIDHWLARVEVGNAYVNRHITGAIVGRQPFGGWKHSAVGRGAKAGGPDDILRFVRFAPVADPTGAMASYRQWWDRQLGVTTELTGLRSEANLLRYRPVRGVLVRPGPDATAGQLDPLRQAAAVTGVPLTIADPQEPDREVAARLDPRHIERLRALGPVSDELARACHRAGIAIDRTPVTGHGRVELPCWLREQSISRTRHRHGRLPATGPQEGGRSRRAASAS